MRIVFRAVLLSEILSMTGSFTVVQNIHSKYLGNNRDDLYCMYHEGQSALNMQMVATGSTNRRQCTTATPRGYSALFTSNKDKDVNDLFSEYMAQRRDKPFSSNYHVESNQKNQIHGKNDNRNNLDRENGAQALPPSAETSRKISTVGQRLKQILIGANEGNLVQPISLTPNKPPAAASSNAGGNSSTLPPNPPSLLPKTDIESINQSLETFTLEMQAKLNQLRTIELDDSSSIPPVEDESGDDFLNQVLKEQRELAMRNLKEKSQLEKLQAYESNMKQELEESTAKLDLKQVLREDGLVQQIIREAEESHKASEKQEDQYRKLKEYEESLKRDLRNMQLSDVNQNDKTVRTNAIKTDSKTGDDGVQLENKSFEQVQLELLEDLLQKRNTAAKEGGFDDEDIFLTDNLEDGIEELRKQVELQKSSKQSSLKPESLKEWQMYRAIATKVANEKKTNENISGSGDWQSATTTTTNNQLIEDSQEIQSKLKAWKEFQEKEQEMREKAGLTVKYKLPFEWSDKPNVEMVESTEKKSEPIDREGVEKARSELDNLALEVLTDLMNKTVDPERKYKLRSEVESLKESITAREEMLKNRSFDVIKPKKVSPITIGELLGSNKNRKQESEKEEIKSDPIYSDLQDMSEEDFEDDSFLDDGDQNDIQSPPDSEFFRDVDDEREAYTETVKYSVDDVIYGDEDDEDDDNSAEISLGTLEQQKFRSMVARSGVRTIEEQNELKRKWEEFEEAEKKMRELAGLSAGDETERSQNIETLTSKVNYDVNTLFKDDGDIDFDKILSSIGTRPSRKQKKTGIESSAISAESKPSGVTAVDAITTKDSLDQVPTDVKEPKQAFDANIKSSVKEVEAMEEVKHEEPVGKGSTMVGNLNKGDIENKFLPNQVSDFTRRKADLLEFKVLSVSQIDSLIELKSSPYSGGVSPYLAKMNKPFKDYGAIFSLEGVLVDVTGLQYEAWMRTAKLYDLPPPVLEDVRLAAVHKEEFAIQRIFFWTDDIFAARKIASTYRDTRKSIFDEWKISQRDHTKAVEPSSSQSDEIDYSSRKIEDSGITMEEQEDVIEIQLRAWTRAAETHGYKPPSRDLLNIVGTLKPDEAVRTVFLWTNDFVVSIDVGNTYRKYLKEETSKWLDEKNINIEKPRHAQVDSKEISKEKRRTSGPSLEDVLVLKQKAWRNVLQNGGYKFNTPSLEEIQVVEFAGLERAIQSIFKWDISHYLAESILKSYRKELKSLTQEWMATIEEPEALTQGTPNEGEATDIDLPYFTLKEGVEKWLDALDEIQIPCAVFSHMEQSLVNEILETSKLSRFFPLENRVCSDNGYDSEVQQMLGSALRIERRPDHCVVFTSTPQSAAACHEVEMKNVAIVSPYPYYELTTSDMTVRDLGSIGVRNLKNIFSEVSVEQPLEQIEVEAPKVRKQTMIKTRFWDEGDR